MQFSQAPFELKLNSPASTLLACANAFRMSSITPVYVAGLERVDVPTADWSITIASGCSGRNTSSISELLPEPATPVTTVRTAVGMSTSTSLRLFARASRIGSQPFGSRDPVLDRQAAIEVAAGERVGMPKVRERALEDDLAAGAAGVRPDVDHVIGRLDHVRVVLDDDHGVAPVAQQLQQLGQAVHVARVEPDARLVEDVHHVDQAAAEVLDQLDALGLAAGQRVGLAVEAQVVQPDVDHVLEPLD